MEWRRAIDLFQAADFLNAWVYVHILYLYISFLNVYIDRYLFLVVLTDVCTNKCIYVYIYICMHMLIWLKIQVFSISQPITFGGIHNLQP